MSFAHTWNKITFFFCFSARKKCTLHIFVLDFPNVPVVKWLECESMPRRRGFQVLLGDSFDRMLGFGTRAKTTAAALDSPRRQAVFAVSKCMSVQMSATEADGPSVLPFSSVAAQFHSTLFLLSGDP